MLCGFTYPGQVEFVTYQEYLNQTSFYKNVIGRDEEQVPSSAAAANYDCSELVIIQAVQNKICHIGNLEEVI